MTQDLNSTVDLEVLLRDFYQRVLADPVIGFLFTDVANIDLDEHIPIVVNFWGALVFKSQTYEGDLFAVHRNVHDRVRLKPGHFTRWLHLLDQSFSATGYQGPNAATMRALAHRIAKSMSAAMNEKRRSDLTLSLDELT